MIEIIGWIGVCAGTIFAVLLVIGIIVNWKELDGD